MLVFIGLTILQVPLAPALSAVVFLGAFIPVIGAPIATFFAAVVALAERGPTIAVLVIALTVVVGSFDGDVLQPLVMGKAVSLHPLAIVFAIAAGGIAMGIIGALIAVPVAGAIYKVAKYLTGRDPDHPFRARHHRRRAVAAGRRASLARPSGGARWQPTRWSSTTPQACIAACMVVGPTKAKPCRFSSLLRASRLRRLRLQVGEPTGTRPLGDRREGPEQRVQGTVALGCAAGPPAARAFCSGRLDLAAVAHDRRRRPSAARRRARRTRRPTSGSKPRERRTEGLALAQDRQPRQAGLEGLQGDPLEQRHVAMDRPTPLASWYAR